MRIKQFKINIQKTYLSKNNPFKINTDAIFFYYATSKDPIKNLKNKIFFETIFC